MFDSNHQNKFCGFDEEIVSYLYDEIGKNEKSRFESHLALCKSCQDEISSLGFVRNSIAEWRTEDFADLSTPSIQIQFDENPQVIKNEPSNSFFDRIGGFFSLSQNWATATAGLVVLVSCVVIALFAFNYTRNNEVAEDQNFPAEKQPQTEKANNQPEKSVVAENTLDKKQDLEVSDDEKQFLQVSTSDDKNGSETVKNPVKKIIPVKRINSRNNQTFVKKENKQVQVRKSKQDINKPNDEMIANFSDENIPKLSNFNEGTEIENDSISLSDLFDEIEDDK